MGDNNYIIKTSRRENYYTVKISFRTINNEAKYEALVLGLSMAKTMGVTKEEVKVDSQVVVY